MGQTLTSATFAWRSLEQRLKASALVSTQRVFHGAAQKFGVGGRGVVCEEIFRVPRMFRSPKSVSSGLKANFTSATIIQKLPTSMLP